MDGAQLEYLGLKLDRIIVLLEAREARELAQRDLDTLARNPQAQALIGKGGGQ